MATRAEIEARMADILNRQDFATRITIWFDRAYNSLQRRFDFKCMEVTEYTTATNGMASVVIPSNIKKSRQLFTQDLTTGKPMRVFNEVSIEAIRDRRKRSGDCRNIFSLWYNTIELHPAIGSGEVGATLRYDYYRYLTPTDNDWFMVHAEDFLVYRGLAESAPFLAADPRLQTWALFQKEAFDELWRSDVSQQTPGNLVMRG